MTTHPLPSGTLVIVGAGRLGRVIKGARIGGAVGYDVATARQDSTEGTATHFVGTHGTQIAEVGVNVCRHPRGQHWCGLVHVTTEELGWLDGGPQ